MSWSFLALIWAHWLGDFVCQSDRMAQGKSTSARRLTEHVAVYGLVLGLVAIPLLGADPGLMFAVTNAALHWATDYVTSRITSRLWATGKRHEFFVVIGLDQALHMTALALTFWWLS